MHAAVAEFERDLIRDRVIAGMRRARSQGVDVGRPRKHRVDADRARALLAEVGSIRAVARRLGVHHSAVVAMLGEHQGRQSAAAD